TFLSDAGWFMDSKHILDSALELCPEQLQEENERFLELAFECRILLLHVCNSFCLFKEGKELFNSIQATISKHQLKAKTKKLNIAHAYMEFSSLFFSQCHCDQA